MKNNFKLLSICVTGFILGLTVNNFAIGNTPANLKVAIVDVNTIVSKSAQVETLKQNQLKETEALKNWLNTVKIDIAKQSTEENKIKLTKKYEADFVKKQENIKKNYTKELLKIEKNISQTIEKEAKAQNFDLVLSKSVVLYGGTDITEAISKAVK